MNVGLGLVQVERVRKPVVTQVGSFGQFVEDVRVSL